MNTRPHASVGSIVLRVLTAAALILDAVVHLHLAPGYQLASPGGIGQGNLFRSEAVAAIVVAAFVLLRGSRAAFGLAALIAGSAFVAVVLYRYVNVPAIGPLPAMYEPVWFFEKSLSAIAEGLGAGLATIGLLTVQPRRRRLPAVRARRGEVAQNEVARNEDNETRTRD